MSTSFGWKGKDRYGSFRYRMYAACAGKTVRYPWERVLYLSALEVCSRQGAIQIHVYLYLILPYLIVLGGLCNWQSMPPICVWVPDLEKATKDSGTQRQIIGGCLQRDTTGSRSPLLSGIYWSTVMRCRVPAYLHHASGTMFWNTIQDTGSTVYRHSRRRQDSRLGRGFETLANLILLRLEKSELMSYFCWTKSAN